MRSFFRVVFQRRAIPFALPPHIRAMSTASSSALLYAATVAAPSIAPTRPEDEITKSKAWHMSNGKFHNPWPSYVELSAPKIVFHMIWRRLSGKGNSPDTTPPTVPVREPKFLASRDASSGLRATWLGHACYYVEFPSGLRVLFDPVFEHRCSPFTFAGPGRYTKAPCAIKDIPTIDAVVISHSHYDHLSLPTVKEIAKTHPECHFIVPLGNKQWFKDSGIEKCTELDWWDEIDFTLAPSSQQDHKVTEVSTGTTPPPASNAITARISCLPCQHIANRGPFDRGATLWSSWAIKSGDKSVYFAGDTGYRCVPIESDGKDDWSEEWSHLPVCPAFEDVGKFRGPFDLGLIPIGAYMPRWIMSSMHSNPRDAVEIFRHTKCKKALGMHWGTWVLTEEDVLEPPRLLKEALAHHQIPEEGTFDVCDIGESREF